MANLSQNDHNIIAEHPLSECLHHLRDTLQKAEQSYASGSLSHDGIDNELDSDLQKTISRLLSALQGHDTAFKLRSKIRNDNVAAELSTLFGPIQRGRFNYQHYRVLSRLVVQEASDIDIWDAVLKFITTISRVTPPTSISVSFDNISITISSSSFQGSEQIRRIIESAMFYEIKKCTNRDVNDFFEKYFEGRRWSYKSKAIYSAVKKQYKGGRWTDFPDPPDENAVWDWLSRFQNKHLSDSHGILYTTESTSDLTDGETQRQLNLFIKRRGIETSEKHE